jgi:hypothetical protein
MQKSVAMSDISNEAISPLSDAYSEHLIFLDLIALIILGEECKL